MSDIRLSIIFPAHNEEQRLPATLETTIAFLNEQSYTSEIIVVENGSTDRTLEIALAYQVRFPRLKVIHEDGKGKGLAVRRGMLEAAGDYRFICDVDLSMPIQEVNRFFPPALPAEQSQIVIASRESPGAVRYEEPEIRHIIGRIFNLLVRVLALPGLNDSQCGFKCFSRRAAEEIFPRQTILGWTFDVEVLYIARRKGYSITEIPIPWTYFPHSKIHVVRDSVQMFFDLLTIRWNGWTGHYDQAG